jgi:hypothetical protein
VLEYSIYHDIKKKGFAMNNIKIRAQKLDFSLVEKHSTLCRGWFTAVGNDSNTLKYTLITLSYLVTSINNKENIKG